MRKLLLVASCAFIVAAFVGGVGSGGSNANDAGSFGARIYAKNCESCHHIGENIIRPDKTMDKSAKLRTKAIFRRFLSRQNGLMPPYLTIVRNDKELTALYDYIKQLNARKKEPSPTRAQ